MPLLFHYLINNLLKNCYSCIFIAAFALLAFMPIYAQSDNQHNYQLEIITEELSYPWGIAFINNDDILITERSGQLRRIQHGKLLPQSVKGVPKILFRNQGGLSDVVLHPQYTTNHFIYLSLSEADTQKKQLNTLRVIRAKLVDNQLQNITTVFKASPLRNTAAHYGARLLFLPDNTLLITSGDGFNYREQAQTLDNHYGKVIRINDDGSTPIDNPFVSVVNAKPEIWSYGHRNLQGLALSPDGSTIYQHEHGPKGGDELNMIVAGKNYGWPAITYGIDYSGAIISPFTKKAGMEQPLKYWIPSIAPSGMTYYAAEMFPEWKNSLFISALVPGDVRRLALKDNRIVNKEILFDTLGRIRNVATAPDGSLMLITDGSKSKLVRIYKPSPH